jgi:hypothetical protein
MADGKEFILGLELKKLHFLSIICKNLPLYETSLSQKHDKLSSF